MRGSLLILAASSVVAAPGFAQTQDDRPRTTMRASPPGRITSLGGVRSQPGVRSAAPRGSSTPPQFVPNPSSNGFGRPLVSRPTLGPGPTIGEPHPQAPPPPVIGNGFTFSGSYRDGPFTLVFSTGGLTRIPLPNDGFIVPVYTGGYAAVLPYGGLGCYFANSSGFSCGYRGVIGPAWMDQPNTVYETPASMAAAGSDTPARPPTPLERAANLLRVGDSKAAVAAYQAYLKAQPMDAVAMRALGLSLIDSGQVGDGVAVIGMAYRQDSTLAAAPVPCDVFGRASRLRSNLERVSGYANREKSASSWLALAVIMQAEGRNPRALAMVNRAQAAGLEEQVVQELTAALTAKPDQGAGG